MYEVEIIHIDGSTTRLKCEALDQVMNAVNSCSSMLFYKCKLVRRRDSKKKLNKFPKKKEVKND